MTAALRLAQRGYQVKLYEQKRILGGNVASRPGPDGVDLDIYPHMFLSWYHNFWRLLDLPRAERAERFHPFSSVKQIRQGEYPKFTGISNVYSRRHMLENVFSGVAPPADLFVFGYASIDLLAERLNPTMLLDDVSVTGFLHARPYMTERAAKACDSFITMVWAIPSYLASAEDYRAYLAYSVNDHTPAFWLANGSARQQVIGPLTAALEQHNVEIVRSVEVTGISCADGRVTEIGLRNADGEERTEEIDELVLAVPPEALSALVRTGERGHRVVEASPRLAEVSRLRTQRIPILHLFFTRKLRHIPPEPVGLFDSQYALAFTDISQTWVGISNFVDVTVLSVSASDAYGLPGTGPEDDAFAMLVELAKYLDFDPGTRWRESSDIDWERTRFEPNTDAQLFVNDTGIDVWRPPAACDGVANLCFAGDFCANRIGMMTIESAVTTGLEAARAIVERRGIGAPVEIAEPDAGVEALYVWLRYALAPYAFAAKAISTGSDWARGLRSLLRPTRPPGPQRRES